MDSTFIVAAGLCLAGVALRSTYEALKKAGRVDPGKGVTFALVFVGMGAFLSSWPVMCPLDPWRIALPDVVRWIGTALVAAGSAVAVAGLVHLRGVENIDHLVTTGLYSWLRHPMYAGFVLWIAGWVIRHGAIGCAVLGLACTANILYWRHLEEDALEAQYGEAYRAYRETTRWLGAR